MNIVLNREEIQDIIFDHFLINNPLENLQKQMDSVYLKLNENHEIVCEIEFLKKPAEAMPLEKAD